MIWWILGIIGIIAIPVIISVINEKLVQINNEKADKKINEMLVRLKEDYDKRYAKSDTGNLVLFSKK